MRFSILILVTWIAAAARPAHACASCGSGGDDPLVLFPAETLKVMAGSSFTPVLTSTGPHGEALTSMGPDSRITSFFAAGMALSNRAFVTLSQPIVRNQRDDRAKTVAGDLSLSGRYTILMPQLSHPFLPQVQIVGGFRPALARSAAESQDPGLLDIGGSGHDEYRAGADIWMGMLPVVKPGIAATITESAARKVAGMELKPGRIVRMTASLTSTVPLPVAASHGALQLKVASGLTADRRGSLTQDGEEVPDSAQSSQGLFASGDFSAGDGNNIKLTWARQGAFGETRNAVVASSWTLSLSRVIQ